MTWQSRADVYVLPTCFGFLTSFYYALPVVSSLVAFTAAACAAAAAMKCFLSVRRVRARADSRLIGCPQEALITQQRPNQRRKERDQRVVKLMNWRFNCRF